MFGITSLGSSIDYMIMDSSQEADKVIAKIHEFAAAGYTFTFDEILAYCGKESDDFMLSDYYKIKQEVEEINYRG